MDTHDIRQKVFPTTFRGYKAKEVDVFKERVADLVEAMGAECHARLSDLKEARQDLRRFRGNQETLEETLNQTRERAAEIKANAEKEAEFIIAEAELHAEKILGSTHNRLAQLHDDIAELKRQRAQFEVRLRSLIEAHLKLLEVEGDRDRELADLDDKIRILRPPSNSKSR